MNVLNDENLEKVVGGAGESESTYNAAYFESQAFSLLSQHVAHKNPQTEKDLGNGYILKLTSCNFAFDKDFGTWSGSYYFEVSKDGAVIYRGGSNDYLL